MTKTKTGSGKKTQKENLRIAGFGGKLDHLEGLLGHLFPKDYFQKARLAENHLGTTRERLSRQRAGTQAVQHRELAKLIDLYRLGRFGLDHTLFRKPMKDFKALLQAKSVGTYAISGLDHARQELCAYAMAASGHLTIQLERRHKHWRFGGTRGIGIDAEGANPANAFCIGDEVKLQVHGIDAGYLVVFSDDFSSEIDCIMPSIYAPEMRVEKGIAIIPTADDLPPLPVGPPPAYYRLYAIWTPEPLPELDTANRLAWLYETKDSKPRRQVGMHLPAIVQQLEKLKTDNKPFQVITCDYSVRNPDPRSV